MNNVINFHPIRRCSAMLARSCMGGKKTAYLKAATTDDIKEALERRLKQIRQETGRNVSESEFVETATSIALFGFDHVQRLEQNRLQKVAGFWSHAGQAQRGSA